MWAAPDCEDVCVSYRDGELFVTVDGFVAGRFVRVFDALLYAADLLDFPLVLLQTK